MNTLNPVAPVTSSSSGIFASVVGVIKYILISVVFVHVTAAFGIVFAFAYPVLWFLFPNKVFCVYCLHQKLAHKDNPFCPVCKREVRSVTNPPLKSIFTNMVTILAVSIISLGIVIVEFSAIGQLTGRFLFGGSQATFESPSPGTYKLNEPFYFDLVVDSRTQAINLIKSDITFDPTILEVVEINTSKSFSTIFSNKDFSNKDGSIRVIGGLPNPGFLGEDGNFVRIQFMAIGTGATNLQILQTSKILANDGKGTNLLDDYNSFPVTVEP